MRERGKRGWRERGKGRRSMGGRDGRGEGRGPAKPRRGRTEDGTRMGKRKREKARWKGRWTSERKRCNADVGADEKRGKEGGEAMRVHVVGQRHDPTEHGRQPHEERKRVERKGRNNSPADACFLH
jgi:hypothetical protein